MVDPDEDRVLRHELVSGEYVPISTHVDEPALWEPIGLSRRDLARIFAR